jgi:HEAT repeat protein
MKVLGMVAIAILISSSTGLTGGGDHMKTLEADLSEALSHMGMATPDLRIRYDYAKPDIFRLPLIDSLMYDPASLPERIDEMGRDLEAESLLAETAWLLWYAMSLEAESNPKDEPQPTRIKDIAGQFAHLPPDLREAISRYLGRIAVASSLRARAVSQIEPHLAFFYDNCASLVTLGEEYEDVGPFELHDLEKAEEALADSVLSLCEGIDVAAVASMSYVAIQAAEDMRVDMESMFKALPAYERYKGGKANHHRYESSVEGRIIYMGLTDFGPIVIGGLSHNTYNGCFALIVDVGGDDIYNLAGRRDVHFRLVVDGAGSDIYLSDDSPAVAGAIFGASSLMDLGGNDTYRSGDISLGAGICGAGLLYDRGGDDTYTSGGFSQGAGFIGLGILKDTRGNDTYVASMQSQAFGYVMGSGLLFDAGGNDMYYTRMARTDILRYDDHYLTLSQGCAFGSRPDYSGGIGLLIDSWGNDLYSSDIFGQGVAYWFAVGAILDRGGHDRYCSYQYAQGAGIHLAFGLLMDDSGDDFYQSKGVSQGCGHDLAYGLLADFSGNDWYTATDLSQGAGNANGTGVLYDADGTDSYSCKSMVNVNGYGNYRREFGSIGLHIDSRGRDYYAALGEDESLWESGRYGMGVDVPAEAKKPAGDIVVNEYPFEERDFTPEDLFILCSRGEPRFRLWRQYAFDRMVADSLASVEYLRTVLDTKDARERHTIKDILRKIGAPAVPMLSEAAREGNDRARAEASWILGLIGSSDAFEALLDLSHAEGWKLRSSGLNSIGKLDDLSPGEKEHLIMRVARVLLDPDEVFIVKKDAAFAAGRQELCDALPLLLDSLEDGHYSVRFSCAEAIRELAEAGCENVAGAIADRLPRLTPIATAAALHASHSLPVDRRLDVVEAALDSADMSDENVSLAVARLANTAEPETEAQADRLQSIMERIPRDFWGVQSVLGRAQAEE